MRAETRPLGREAVERQAVSGDGMPASVAAENHEWNWTSGEAERWWVSSRLWVNWSACLWEVPPEPGATVEISQSAVRCQCNPDG